jgi:adenylyltransferase/sulfurtransferase
VVLNELQKERFDRNIRLKGLGEAGQAKLLNASVLVIGAGGLGSAAILYLAAAGIGTVGVADGDSVEISNLQRQILYDLSDIGKLKAVCAKEKIERINPELKVSTYPEKITAKNIEGILTGYDFILECTDDLASKFLINDACVLLSKPFCHAGVLGFSGRMMTFLPGHACMRCAFEDPRPASPPNSRQIGILGAAAGALGAMQAAEAIKFLTGCGRLLTDAVLHMDLADGSSNRLSVRRNKNCPACGNHPTKKSLR